MWSWIFLEAPVSMGGARHPIPVTRQAGKSGTPRQQPAYHHQWMLHESTSQQRSFRRYAIKAVHPPRRRQEERRKSGPPAHLRSKDISKRQHGIPQPGRPESAGRATRDRLQRPVVPVPAPPQRGRTALRCRSNRSHPQKSIDSARYRKGESSDPMSRVEGVSDQMTQHVDVAERKTVAIGTT